MQRSDIALHRLAAQGLLAPLGDSAAEVVRRLGAVQAQDFAGAKWAIGRRGAALRDADVERAFAEGEIVRTHVLRPTWHFVAREDLRWMLALTGPRVAQAMSSSNRALGLDAALFRRSNAAIERALVRAAHPLTRAELAEALRRARIDATGTGRLVRLVMQAEVDAVICSGPRRGAQFTYVLADERVPPSAPLERDEALRALALRYFATRGPATARDLAWWSGLMVGDAARAIAAAGAALERVTIDDAPHWLDPSTRSPEPERARRRAPVAHMLPNYDEYFIGYRDRGAIAHRLGTAALVTGGDARITHVATIDGQLVGGWKREAAGDGAVIAFRPATPLTTAEARALAREAERYATFLGVPVELRERA